MSVSESSASARALTFTRPSRSGGADHVVSVDAGDLCPVSCTCPAGQHGLVCWAALDVALDQDDNLRCLALERIHQAQDLAETTAACKIYAAVVRRRVKAAAELAKREQLETDPDVIWFLTETGQDALARATAEAWLFGTTPSCAESFGLARPAVAA
jgi:hypothetical protein